MVSEWLVLDIVCRDGVGNVWNALRCGHHEDMGEVESRMRLKSELETVGGRVIGLVYNRAREVTQHRRDTPKARAAL